MTQTMSEIDKKLANLQDEINRLTSERKALEQLTATQRLAISLHRRFSRGDDEWYYHMKDGVPTWDAPVHMEYYRKAEAIARQAGLTPSVDEDMIDQWAKLFDNWNTFR